MPIRTALLMLCLLALGTAPAQAQFNAPNPAPGEDFHVEVGVMLWTPTPEISIQTGALAAIGDTELDFVREFEIENTRFTEFRAVVKGGKHKLRFNYLPLEYNEETTLTRQITFGDRTFDVGIPVSADLRWELWTIGYEYDLAAGDRGFFGIIGALAFNRVSATLDSPISGTEFSEVSAPAPTIGLIGRGYLSRSFSITTEFTGIKMPDRISERFDATLFNFDIYGTINFGRHVGVQGGYRSLSADYDDEDDAGDLAMKGYYFGGLLRF